MSYVPRKLLQRIDYKRALAAGVQAADKATGTARAFTSEVVLWVALLFTYFIVRWLLDDAFVNGSASAPGERVRTNLAAGTVILAVVLGLPGIYVLARTRPALPPLLDGNELLRLLRWPIRLAIGVFALMFTTYFAAIGTFVLFDEIPGTPPLCFTDDAFERTSMCRSPIPEFSSPVDRYLEAVFVPFAASCAYLGAFVLALTATTSIGRLRRNGSLDSRISRDLQKLEVLPFVHRACSVYVRYLCPVFFVVAATALTWSLEPTIATEWAL